MLSVSNVILSVVFFLMATHQAHATLTNSTKPHNVVIYVEDSLPFSGFDAQDNAQGLLVEYWKQWSIASEIDIVFKETSSKAGLNSQLNIHEHAIYSGLSLHPSDKSKLHSISFIGLASKFYYLPKKKSFIKSALIQKSVPIVVGGLLPEARKLPLIEHNANMRYKEYAGALEMLFGLYTGDIDAFVFFHAPNAPVTAFEKILGTLLSSISFNENSNEFYAYTTLRQQKLLSWIKWGLKTHTLEGKLSPLVVENTAPIWGVSETLSRYLYLVSLLALLAFFTLYAKRRKGWNMTQVSESIPYPFVVCSLDGSAIYHKNEAAEAIFSFTSTQEEFVFSDRVNQVLIARLLTKKSEQNAFEKAILRLQLGTRAIDIEVWGKRIHYFREPAWLCYFSDVTAALALQERYHEERALLRGLLDSMPEQVYIKSLHGELLACNDAWAKAHGTSVSAAIGKEALGIHNGEQIAEEEDVWKGKKVSLTQWEKQGTQFTSLLTHTKAPIVNDQGTVFSLLSITRDDTEMEKVKQQLRTIKSQRSAAK